MPRKTASPALFACMLFMVLANLVFVQLTKAADPLWVLPLYVLTLAAPILARFREKLWYRGFWNLLVVAFMGLLVQHALAADLASVLQDGLLLAALSQVHLLNNLRAEQRPDLLFLNSFLIAIITAYITVDTGFALAFAVYVPFFVLGMQFLAVAREEVTLAGNELRSLLLDGAKRSFVLLGLAFLVFLFWPRDFDREAMLGKYINLEGDTAQAEVGFSESLALEQAGGVSAKRRLAMVVTLEQGEPSDVPELWRGATLPMQDENGDWQVMGGGLAEGRSGTDPTWQHIPGGLTRSKQEVPGSVRLKVTRRTSSTPRLFLPRGAHTIRLNPMHQKGELQSESDGTVRYTKPGVLHYELELNGTGGFDGSEGPAHPIFVRRVRLAQSVRAEELSKELREQLSEGADQGAIVQAFAEHLSNGYPYRFPGDPAAAADLTEFLTSQKGGHCEFFASALVTMLRAQDIPSRVVTGYRANRWDEATRTREFYNLDAHAWVEVFDQGRGWYEVDPTPVREMLDGSPGLWARTAEAFTGLWNRVTGFDGDSRRAVMALLKEAPGRGLRWALEHPALVGTWVLGLLALVLCRRSWRRRRVPASVREWNRALAKVGIDSDPSKTPRELLECHRTELSTEACSLLGSAVEEHERARYQVREVSTRSDPTTTVV